MATMMRNESRRLYSWWWDSHISPKNSKWLQENLTDMDAKVKSMIKLIEEDADSFARRAEMYYKKRPELMKLVEEFYRAYRALAERYDHATVELRHAHRTMAQAFPDQVPFGIGDESQTCSSGPEGEPHAPELSLPMSALGISSTNSNNSAMSKRGLKQLNEMANSECSGQNFEDGESEVSSGDRSLKKQIVLESDRAAKAETEVQSLKKTLAKVQAEKDTLLYQFQQNVEKLKNAERDLSVAQKDVTNLDEQVSQAEIEIKKLRESLSESKSERDDGLLRLNDCLVRISSLEIRLSQAQEEGKGEKKRAAIFEAESESLRKEMLRLMAEKEAGLARNRKCLERISELESRIALAEKNARLLGEQVEKSEAEVESLKKALVKMAEEKEATELQYGQCLEIISMMEVEISRAQANTERLNGEILIGAAKLKSVEDQCAVLEGSNRTLQSEAYNLLDKISKKDRELSEKNDELAKFQSLVLDENAKFQQVEATLQALQKLHSQSQEDQRALTSEIKDGLRMLKAVEICKNGVEEELRRVKDENKSLSELKFSSALSVASLRDEILHLKEMKENLEDEVARRVDQSETLQQEIGTLNDEINGLKNRYCLIIKQVDSVGLNPECLESAVKDLRDENLNLRECCKRDHDEMEILRKRVNNMSELSTENIVLQDSMSGLKFELEDLTENVKKLQDSCDSLEGEKSILVAEKVTLLSQLQMITENMQKLFDKNSSLESSLSGANSELEQVRLRSKNLDDLCETLDSEKANLINERSDLVSQLANVEKRLGELEIRFTELEEKYEDLKEERNSTVDQVEELRSSLMAEKHERSSYVQSNEARLAGLTNDVRVLQDETRLGKKEFEEELDRAVNAQVEIFILQKFVEDLEEKNFSLLIDCQKHADAKKFSDKLISELESENLEQQVEAEYLVNEIEKLRLGIHLVFKALQIDDENEQVSVRGILEDIEDLKSSLSVSEDEELKLMVENSVLLTLLAQMRDIGSGIESEKQEFEIMNKRSNRQEEALKIELEALRVKMVNLQGSYDSLQEENSKVIKENRVLVKKLLELKEEKSLENDAIVHEAAALSTLSMVLESFTVEKASALQSLSENLNALKVENVRWRDSVEVLRKELSKAGDSNDRLSLQVLLEKDFLKAKSNELSEADQKIKITERLNGELCATVEELKFEREELKLNREILAQKIVELAEESSNRKIEVESLSEMNYDLETKVGLLCQEIEEHRIREENLSTELREKGNDFELWEAEASGFYFNLQISAVREVLLENKVHELVGICECLEDERSAKDLEIEEIKRKVSSLESHIGKLEAKLCDYVPVVASLRENVASLERNARMKAKLLEANDRAQKAHRREKSNEKVREGQSGEIPDGISDLKRMQRTIKAVEKAMVEEMEKLAVEAVEKAMEKEVERLAVRETNADPVADVRDRIAGLKPRSDVNLMKDIQLDQVSDRSLYRSGMRHAGVPETDQKMLQLWEAAEENRASSSSSSVVDADVGPADEPRNQASELTEDTAEPRSRRQSGKSSSAQRSSSSELHFERERELGIDKLLERKQRSGGAATGSKAKILERLASDAQKLTSLQRSVVDLKKKLETNGCNNNNNNKKGNNHRGNLAEFETVQRHLLEVEESVVELVGVNGRLAKDAEESRKSSEGGKRVAEQAKKGAEKIGQLQFEVQNINYILMKLDGGNGSEGATGEKSKGKASRFTGVLLKDFIYSSRRKRLRRKKSCFCVCAKPKTRED